MSSVSEIVDVQGDAGLFFAVEAYMYSVLSWHINREPIECNDRVHDVRVAGYRGFRWNDYLLGCERSTVSGGVRNVDGVLVI